MRTEYTFGKYTNNVPYSFLKTQAIYTLQGDKRYERIVNHLKEVRKLRTSHISDPLEFTFPGEETQRVSI